MGRLAGRATPITATGDSPGDSLVRVLPGEGALIAANHIKPEVAERSAAIAVEAGSRGITVGAHLLDLAAVAAAVAKIVAEFGRLDVSSRRHLAHPERPRGQR